MPYSSIVVQEFQRYKGSDVTALTARCEFTLVHKYADFKINVVVTNLILTATCVCVCVYREIKHSGVTPYLQCERGLTEAEVMSEEMLLILYRSGDLWSFSLWVS